MSFLYPAFLLGAIAIALPIALHLLRRDVAPEVPFSAVRLLRRSPIDRTRRRRLRDLILLAARVAALALLAMAFARPYLTGSAASPGVRVIAVDRSFSMGAPGRFSRALELASAAVGDAGAAERVAVIGFDDRADVVAQPGSAADARAALAALAPGSGGTRYAPAVAKALETIGDSAGAVVIVTDLQRNGWEDQEPIAIPSRVQVDVRDVGPLPPNAAVTQVRVEAERVVGTVSNSSWDAFAGTARVAVEGRGAVSVRVSLPAGESADVAVPFRAPGRGALLFSIDDAQGFPADNARYAVLDAPAQVRVLVIAAAGVPPSGLYLMRALEAAEDTPFNLRLVSGAELSALPPQDASAYAAVVLLSTRGMDRRGRDLLPTYVRGGGGLLVAAGPDVDPSVLASALGWIEIGTAEETSGPALSLSVSDVRHAVFRPFGAFVTNLGQVRFERTWKLTPRGWEVAARFTDGSPALIERQEGQGRAMILASDLDRRWNEFPLHPGFVPFVVESVRYVANARERAGDYVVANAPAGAEPAPGVYTMKDGRTIAVNVDARESTASRLTAREFGAMLPRAEEGENSREPQEALRAPAIEGRQNLWQYGLVLMLAVLVLESLVGRA
jgi:hypothetical protein